MVYKSIIKPILFLFPPEKAHHITISILKWCFFVPGVPALLKALFTYKNERLHKPVLGLNFKNPIGLAAGFDKDAKNIDEFSAFGFGFIEVGTLTPKAQTGNKQPRLFRLPADNALINRMGFNNRGTDEAVKRLKKRKSKIIVGGNIGKNKITSNELAACDYLYSFEALFSYVDYFVINVSSPNTLNLRDLQEKKPLRSLLIKLQKRNMSKPKPKPILLKIAPDLSFKQLDDIIEIVKETGIAGIVATNTTINREGLSTSKKCMNKIQAGGLSGAPIKKKSNEVIRYLHKKSEGSFPIVAVGGVFTGKDALEKLEAGASLVQIYTGFVYEGPGMVKKINQYLATRL